jgi:diguanylate cyclase (GGDEF)-like protein
LAKREILKSLDDGSTIVYRRIAYVTNFQRQPVIVTAATIVPDEYAINDAAGQSAQKLPVYVALNPIDEHVFENANVQFGLADMRWVSDLSADVPSNHVTVDNPDGTTVGAVAWRSQAGQSTTLRTLLFSMSLVAIFICALLYAGQRVMRKLFVRVSETEAQFNAAVETDPLTKLINRAGFVERMTALTENAAIDEKFWVDCFNIDLDHFKELNDSHGHIAGDFALVELARRLSAVAPEGSVVSRIGSDEFALLVSQHSDEAVMRLAQRLFDEVRKPIFLQNSEFVHLDCCIAVARAPRDARTPSDLARAVDAAANQAKREGRSRIIRIDEDLNSRLARRRLLEAELRLALENDALDVHYQPIVDARTGEVKSVEALARWMHPRLGFISPAEFIPIAEERDIIDRIGTFVLVRACREALPWTSVNLSVNVSAEQLRRGDLVTVVMDALRATGFPPRRLILEVTETGLIRDESSAGNQLRALRALGVQLALDDFGTGYSGLIYLKRFDFDVIKIDRGFIRDIDASSEGATLVAKVIELANALDLKIVAEGVETTSQRNKLAEFGCSLLQGFLFCKPKPASDLHFLVDLPFIKIAA